MAWITTKDGRRVDTEWFEEDERKKYQQIEENQKQADKLNGKHTSKEEPIKGTPLIFATAIVRGNADNSRTIIDGYSNKKTERGALEDLAKAVARYDPANADFIREMIKDDSIEPIKGDPSFGIDWEEVSHAVKAMPDGVEDEYKPARWYLTCHFIR